MERHGNYIDQELNKNEESELLPCIRHSCNIIRGGEIGDAHLCPTRSKNKSCILNNVIRFYNPQGTPAL